MNIKFGILVLAGVACAISQIAEAAVTIERKVSDLQTYSTLTYQGVRMREELTGYAGPRVALTLPDENRIVELNAQNRTYTEKPLGAGIGELRSMQQWMAQDAELLDEQVSMQKLDSTHIAGMECRNYRIEWNAQVRTSQGLKKYSITDKLCISQSSSARAARDAVRRHVLAIAERFGEVVDYKRGELSIFDMGKMFFGVPAKKYNIVKAQLGGFALREEIEVNFGGALLEPMARSVVKKDGGSDEEADEMVRDMQRGMQMMQDPKFQARMREAMKQLNDPAVQAQLQQVLSSSQQQALQKSSAKMQNSGNPLPIASANALHIRSEVVRITVSEDKPERTEIPKEYAFTLKKMQTVESREPDTHDGAGALSKTDIQRIFDEMRSGRKPSQASPDYPVVPKSSGPWMSFYREWDGVPYQWGGNTKSGVDCSGLTKNAYATVVPLAIPRTTAEQMNIGPRITLNHIKAGDLIFFDTGFRHVGVYLAQNKFFHASSSKGVTISTLGNSYWSKAYRFAVRPGVR